MTDGVRTSQEVWYATLVERALRETGDEAEAIVAAELALSLQPFPEDDSDIDGEEFDNIMLAWAQHGTGAKGAVAGKRRWFDSISGQMRYQGIMPGTRQRAAVAAAPAATGASSSAAARPGATTTQPKRPTPPPSVLPKPTSKALNYRTQQPSVRAAQPAAPVLPVALPPAPPPAPRPVQPKPAMLPKVVPQSAQATPKENYVEAVFAGQKIRTVQSTKDAPLTADQRKRAANNHAKAASYFSKSGDTKTAKAHSEAAKYHAKIASSKSQPPLPPTESHKKLAGNFRKTLELSKHLNDTQRKEYGDAMEKVVNAMPATMVDMISKNVKTVKWHANVDSATSAYNKAVGKAKQMKEGRKAKGFFNTKTGDLNLDGEVSLIGLMGGGRRTDIAGVYSHEMFHAAEGSLAASGKKGIYKFSGTPEFRGIWQRELIGKDKANPRLSAYAVTNSQEGGAEFNRLIYGTDIDAKTIRKEFPEASAYFIRNGLWDGRK